MFPGMRLADVDRKKLEALISIAAVEFIEGRDLAHKRRSSDAAELEQYVFTAVELRETHPVSLQGRQLEIGRLLAGALARVNGGAGALIDVAALVLAGVLLVTGASAGAVLRRSGHAVRRAGTAARRSIEGLEWTDRSASEPAPRSTPWTRAVSEIAGATPTSTCSSTPDRGSH